MLIFIVLGLIIGSFLNVVILRFDELASIVSTRSHCPKCKKTLSWFDLIPVLSYVFLFGKCRHCKASISLQYPIVELGTALIFALIYWKFGLSLATFFLLAVSSILIIIFVYDSLNLLISDTLVIAAASLWLVYLIINIIIQHQFQLSTLYFQLSTYLYGALALGGLLGFLVLISKEKWMGAGDIGLGALLGAIVGWPSVIAATFSAFVLGSIIGIILMIFKKKGFQAKIPFAPFLVLGMFIALFWGEAILKWYFSYII